MCGIVGFVRCKQGDITGRVHAMRDSFPYRGPDDKGCWVQPELGVALGHRRLSIIDPSPAGHQPMHDEINGLIIVFNGEIYNYIEVRKELQGLGHLFRTKTDTEVIIKAFLHWGEHCLHRFNGMFAFAIWQKKTQELFLARDRLGVKPLYYYEDNSGFYFASEVKAILRVLPKRPRLQEGLIDAYMSFGYVPGEDTLHAGIKRLLPGHCLTVNEKSSTLHQYWNLSFSQNEDKGERYYLGKAQSLLDSAIELRLRSDVPLGIFLSGGLDSSAVVGSLAPKISEPLKTFSVAYDFGDQFNEMPYARLVANKFQTEHYEIFITPDEFARFIPEYIRLMDEPVAEAAAISLYYVSKLAKEHVTVVLSGEGSDEIFAGYDLYKYMNILERYLNIVGEDIAQGLANMATAILPLGNKIAKYLQLGSLPLEKRYKGISTYEERYKRGLYRTDFIENSVNATEKHKITNFLQSLFVHTAKNDVLSRMLYFDTKSWLVDDLLIKADRMSMAASLELRVPFLDYRLVEFAATMPSHYKVRGHQGKYLLKRMMKDILPQEIIHRKKMGFPTPLKKMFEGALFDYAHDTLLASTAMCLAFFHKETISLLLQEHRARQMDHHRIIWQLIVLENWLQENKRGFSTSGCGC